MTTSRRQFIKGIGATAAVSALYSRDLVAELIASAPSGRVLESKFKGMADIALGEAKLAGTSYADIRFTMTTNPPGATLNYRAEGEAAAAHLAAGRHELLRALPALVELDQPGVALTERVRSGRTRPRRAEQRVAACPRSLAERSLPHAALAA